MRKQKRNSLGEKLSGKYIDADTLSDKINRQIKSGAIQVSNAPLTLSPMACLNLSLTYKIYDCLYDNEPLTPAEIVSLIGYEKPEGIVTHTLERMS